MNAMERVNAARAKGRPTGVRLLTSIASEFLEMHGDRRYSDDRAVVGGIGKIGDRPVTVIALEKGTDTKDRIRHNFGCAHPEGYRKALRLMKQAEKFGRPVITFVDTSGAFCGIEAEQRGQGQAIAENLTEMMTLKVPIIAVLIGEGGSGGALALAVADEVWMLENAVYSVITPEGCANILWKDPEKAPQAAESLRLTAQDLLSMQIIDRIIPEVKFEQTCAVLKDALAEKLAELAAMDPGERAEKRYRRFRRMGGPAQ